MGPMITAASVDSRDSEGNTLLHLMYQNYTDLKPSDHQILDKLLNCG